MPTLHRNGLLGDKPNWYRETHSRRMPHEIWVRWYTLSSPDSFEHGGAYSFHTTKHKAEKFKPASWWVPGLFSRGPMLGYVSKKTLDRITVAEKKGDPIFIED